MPSQTRQEIHQFMATYAQLLNLKNKKVLDVGIAGDPQLPGATSPSEKYQWFGPGNYFRTLDNDPATKPDYVGNICGTDFPDNHWDLVILSETLEHIFDFEKALTECHRIIKPGGSFIIDTPWMYPYHPTDTTPDYWRFSVDAYNKLLPDIGFSIVSIEQTNNLISVLCKKNT